MGGWGRVGVWVGGWRDEGDRQKGGGMRGIGRRVEG